MQVIDEVSGNKIDAYSAIKVIVGLNKEDETLIYGYIDSKHLNLIKRVLVGSRGAIMYVLTTKFPEDELFFSRYYGMYRTKIGLSQADIQRESKILGKGGFPYSFERMYEAVDNFQIFQDKDKLIDTEFKHPLAKQMNYTFGLEFETCKGYIPEDICFRDGLIPLRDGSISGLEYSTLVLQGNSGLSMLKQQIGTLQEYTRFDKDCSLHIHFGGYPLQADKLWALYSVCYRIQNNLKGYVPKFTFYSSRYKSSGKDYCKFLPDFDSFNELYETFVGRRFFGDLSQPHPNDPKRCAKWRIPHRYYWVNFINAMCYKVNKTIEFRLLRPTFNYAKITLWMYVFNAVLKYADKHSDTCHLGLDKSSLRISDILDDIYPKRLASKIKTRWNRLSKAVLDQEKKGDYIGSKVDIDNKYIPVFEII